MDVLSKLSFNCRKFVTRIRTSPTLWIRMTSLSAKLSANYERFSNDTNITGFKELFYSKSYVFKFIWLIILLFGICFTLYECWYSMNNYLETPTDTDVQQLSENPKYPPMKICYPHWIFWLDWSKFLASNLSLNREGFLYGMSFLKTVFMDNAQFDYATAKENFEQMMSKKNFSTLSAYYLSIVRDTPIGINVLPPGVQFETVFHEYYGSEMCYYANILYNTRKSSKRGQIVKMQFNFDYSLKFDFLSELEVNYYRLAAFAYQSSSKGKMSLFGNESQVFVSPMIYSDGTRDQVMPDPNYFQYKIKLKGHLFRWLKTKEKSCWTDENNTPDFNSATVSLCKRKCDFNHKIKLGTCQKFSDISSNTDFSFRNVCTQDIVYANQFNEKTLFTMDVDLQTHSDNETQHDQPTNQDGDKEQTDCISKCIRPCEQWVYETDILTNLRPYQMREHRPSSTYVEIQYPVPDTIVVMTENPSKTWQDLLSDVGGLLGLWVGATLFSFAQIIYFCCCNECDEWCAKQEAKRANRDYKKHASANSVAPSDTEI